MHDVPGDAFPGKPYDLFVFRRKVGNGVLFDFEQKVADLRKSVFRAFFCQVVSVLQFEVLIFESVEFFAFFGVAPADLRIASAARRFVCAGV